jgi:hypothetical protein
MGTFTRPNALYDLFTRNTLEDRLFPGEPTAIKDVAGPAGVFEKDDTFVFSPEGQRLIDSVQAREGKRIGIKPSSSRTDFPRGSYGVFFSNVPEGGSADPEKRFVYVDPSTGGNNLYVISHELGHAFDPALVPDETAYHGSWKARADSLMSNAERKNPVGFLKTYILGPELKVRRETEAQRASSQNLKEIGYPTREIEADPSFKGYPGSFINKGLDQSAALYSLPLNVPEGAPSQMLNSNRERVFNSMGGGNEGVFTYRPALGPNDPELNFSDSFVQNLLDLSLNKKYQEAEQSIRNRNRDYINSVLGE